MKAKLVNEALKDVLTGPDPAELENLLLKAIETLPKDESERSYPYYKSVSRIVNNIVGSPDLFQTFIDTMEDKSLKIPKEIFDDILMGLKYKDPSFREIIGKTLKKGRLAIMDRDSKEVAIDREKGRQMLINYGFKDVTTPRQEKNGSLAFQHPDDDKIEKERYKKQGYNIGTFRHIIKYIIYPNGAVRKSNPSMHSSAISKMKVEDPFLTFEENAQYLIDYMNKKKTKYGI